MNTIYTIKIRPFELCRIYYYQRLGCYTAEGEGRLT